MEKYNSVLKKYRSSDFNDRLNIFLEFRDLRDEFLDIEIRSQQVFQEKEALQTNHRFSTVTKWMSIFLGGGAIVYFTLFLIFGAALSIQLNMGVHKALAIDFCLSLLFFVQHSVMVRHQFKKWVSAYIPEYFVPRIYSITSGITLLLVIAFWQPAGEKLVHLPFWVSSVSGVLFVGALCGFYWGVSSLSSGAFDPFGIRLKKNEDKKKVKLKIAGPYKYMRHPLYFFALIQIWATTSFTLDRLLFNLLWSAWIVFGSILEEKELVDFFGQDYIAYQKAVPMLFPGKTVSNCFYKSKLFDIFQ